MPIHKIIGLLILVFSIRPFVYSQNAAATTFVLNPNILTDKEKISFYAALKQIYKLHIDTSLGFQFEPVLYDVVKTNEKDSKSIDKAYNIDKKENKDLFNFIDTSFKKKTVITDLVSSEGQQVQTDYLPILPKLPNSNKLNNVQVIDYFTKKAF